MLVFDLLAHPPPRDILCCLLCCAYAYAKVCGGWGTHMPMHASSVLVFISVCVLPLHSTPTPPRTLGPVTLSWCGGPVDIGTPRTDRKIGVPEWTETSHWGPTPLAWQLTETLPVPHPPCVHTGSRSGEQRGSWWVSPWLVFVCHFSRVGW